MEQPEPQDDFKDIPPSSAELIDNLDSYQKRVENEWDSAKASYQAKINQIMEEFLKQGFTVENPTKTAGATPPPRPDKPETMGPPPPPKSHTQDPYIAKLLSRVEEELRHVDRKGPKVPFFGSEGTGLGLPWKPSWKQRLLVEWKKTLLGLMGAICIGSAFYYFFTSPRLIDLPYGHTLGPVIIGDKIYISDWFRKALYVHQLKRGLPLLSVENLPNSFATGLAFDAKSVWTMDSIERKFLKHALTADHQVNASFDTPGKKPMGLFHDGTDLWSADLEEKKLYQHRGNDIEDIKDEFVIPDITLGALAMRNNRVWILDSNSRELSVHRLQKPLKPLGAFDLDPFLKGATPTGFSFQGKDVWILTENPSRLIRVPLRKIEKSKTETF